MADLIPPDYERCQSEFREGGPFTLGPRRLKRCSAVPVYIATENKPSHDGQVGSMSLCAECAEVMQKQLGEAFATLTPIPCGEDDEP